MPPAAMLVSCRAFSALGEPFFSAFFQFPGKGTGLGTAFSPLTPSHAFKPAQVLEFEAWDHPLPS